MRFYETAMTPTTGIDGFFTRWSNESTGQSSDIWLAFKSEQLKSATDNIGTYDRRNKDIEHSFTEEEEGPKGLTLPGEIDDYSPESWERLIKQVRDFAGNNEQMLKKLQYMARAYGPNAMRQIHE